MATIEKRITICLTKYDNELLLDLQKFHDENRTQIVQRGLQMLHRDVFPLEYEEKTCSIISRIVKD